MNWISPPARASVVALILVCNLTSVRSESIWGFVPTPLEWQAWPIYCRVQWTQWNGGLDLDNNATYSDAQRNDWKAALGERTYMSLHHWCASIHYLDRARASSDSKTKGYLLGRARDDAEYTYARADPQSPVYPNVSVTIAQLRLESGSPDAAVDVLKRAIDAQPKRPEAYGALSLLYRKQHQIGRARDVLLDADRELNGESAEIKYSLGLIEIENGDVPAAVSYAKQAYAMGYPLQGLKNKLEKLGGWR